MAFRNALDIGTISRMFEPKTQNPIEELMEGYLRPQERAIDFKSKQLAQALKEQYGAEEKEADIDYKRALAQYNRSMLGKPKSAFGNTMYDINQMEAGGEISPEQAAQFKKAIMDKAAGKGSSLIPAQVKGKQMQMQIASAQRIYAEKILNQPYMGFAADIDLMKDLGQYNKTANPEEKKALAYKLALAIAANKFLPEMAGLQIVSQGMRDTLSGKKEQKEAISFGWPKSLGIFSKNAPKEIQRLAEKIHAEELEKVRAVGVDAYQKLVGGQDSAYYDGYNQQMQTGEQVNETEGFDGGY